MKGLVGAIRFLTRLPVPPAAKADLAQAMRWFPLVGLLVGGILLGGAMAGARLGPGVGAAVALLLWVWVTGALHLDGLADIADALGASHGDRKGNRERLQEVLHDPHTGSFALVAVALLLIIKFALLQALLGTEHCWPLLLVPAAARFLPLLWARFVPLAHTGLASRFAAGWPALLFWGLAFLALLPFQPAFSLLLLYAPLWGWWVKRRLGGISGDSHGAGIEIGEALLLLALVAGAQL